MSSVVLGDITDFNPADDTDWTADITLTIAPDPDLSENQSKVIALDYGMTSFRSGCSIGNRCHPDRNRSYPVCEVPKRR